MQNGNMTMEGPSNPSNNQSDQNKRYVALDRAVVPFLWGCGWSDGQAVRLVRSGFVLGLTSLTASRPKAPRARWSDPKQPPI